MATLRQRHSIKFVIAAFITCGFIILMAMNEELAVAFDGNLAVLGAAAFCSIFIFIYLTCCKGLFTQDRSYRVVPASGSPVNGVCIVANSQGTVDAIEGEVRRLVNQSYPIDPYLVINKKDIADLPTYRHAICCVSNAPRIISFNDHGELEPDADLGFRAFVKMERLADPNGVIVIVFNHDKSKGSSKLHSMEEIHLPPRLQDLADRSCLLTVYRHFNEKQQKRIVECIKPSVK
ncbi:uncharacterized protein LOC144884819 [Branchiostoma floridae x Branchiostoma japonicum]